MGPVLLVVDYQGEWVEKAKSFVWVPVVKESRPILVSKQVTFNELVEKIIQCWGILDDPRDLSITYLLSIIKQKTAPSHIRNDNDVSLFMADVDASGARPTLRVNLVPRTENSYEQNHVVDDIGEGASFKNVLEKEEGVEEAAEMQEENEVQLPDSLPSQGSHIRKDGTGFYVGQTFTNKRELVVLLKLAAVRVPFYFEYVKNKKSVFCARCVDKNCYWWIRAMKYKSCDMFYITVYNGTHTCGSEHVKSYHPHATGNVVGEYMKDRFHDGKAPSTKEIKDAVLAELGCKISYWKCLKGSYIAKSLARGSPEHGYAVLGAYSYMIRQSNPGSKTALQLDDQGRFLYFFVSYGAWIRGFKTIRKVLAVDITFLTGPYGGVLLSAVGQDAQTHIFPVAFCVVDKECDAAYEFFFEQLAEIVPDDDELCIISDRHRSIEKSVNKVFPFANYGYCMRHLGENLRTTFHCGKVVGKYITAAEAYTVDQFDKHLQEIKDIDPRVSKYLVELGVEKWSRAHFPGNRFNVMTTNIAESVNSMFRNHKEFPIDSLFNAINENYAEKFLQRRMEFLNSPNTCVPLIEDVISANNVLGSKLLVHRVNTSEFKVKGGPTNMTYEVDLHNRTCTCKRFDLDKIPCPHALAAMRVKYPVDFGRKIYE